MNVPVSRDLRHEDTIERHRLTERLFGTIPLLALLAFVVAILSLPCPSFAGDPLDTWHWRNPLPTGEALGDICAGNGTLVAVGPDGTVLTSTDAITWSHQQVDGRPLLRGVAWGNGTFVAVSLEGTIISSTDGVSWTVRHSTPQKGQIELQAVAWGNGLFVAVGTSYETQMGLIFTSPDGIVWTERATGFFNSYNGVAWGNGRFVVVGYNSLVSEDGITWELGSQLSGNMEEVTYGNGLFVAVGQNSNGNAPIHTSVDGLTWTERQSGTADMLKDVTWGDGRFVAVGTQPNGVSGHYGAVHTSPDGISWTAAPPLPGRNLYGIVREGEQYVAVGRYGAILTSPNGQEWTPRSEGFSDTLWDVVFGRNTFVAIGAGGTVVTSPDGSSWTRRDAPATVFLTDIAWGGDQFVAVGEGGTIIASPDGTSWSSRTSGVTALLWSITWGNGLFVAVGEGGTILTSADGTTWAQRQSGTETWLEHVVFGNGTFVASDASSTVLLSTDGITWLPVATDTAPSISAVAFGNGLFVSVNRPGDAAISRDGITWAPGGSLCAPEEFACEPRGITWANGRFVVTGFYHLMASSIDGVTWVRHPIDTWNELLGSAFGANSVVVVGAGGSILQSAPFTPALAAAPEGLAFGMVSTEDSSPPQEVTLANTGFAELHVTSIGLTDTDAALFSVSPGGSSPCPNLTPTLAPGMSCTLRVAFAPQTVGEKTAALTILSDDPANPLRQMGLTGTGQVPSQMATRLLTITRTGSGSGTITSSPAGISCLTSGDIGCSANFITGQEVLLIATPSSISLFAGWGGGCSGNDNCTVPMTDGTSVEARFELADKARIETVGYPSFAAAYADADHSTTIKLLEDLLPLDWTINKSLTIRGGYERTFSSQDGYTILEGVLSVGNGSLEVERVIIQ